MSFFRLSIKNLMYQPLQALLSLLLLALGIGLVDAVWQVKREASQQLERSTRGIDMVLGAKGSPLQLILSAVLQIDNPTGNIPLSEANRIRKHPLVSWSIPLSYGDSFQGYRIVGTDSAYIGLYGAELAAGSHWKAAMQVVLGAEVAQALNLRIGDSFKSMHGLSSDGHEHEQAPYVVVGILEPSNSPLDRLILSGTESIWAVHHNSKAEDEVDHLHEGEGHDHEEEPDGEGAEITALLVKFKSPAGAIMLPRLINENTVMQAAVPSYQIERLLSLMGTGIRALNAIALIILLVSAGSVFISLYTALRDRKYELALLRTYGASRLQLFQVIVQEGMMLSLLGSIIGILLSKIGLWLFTQMEPNAGGQLFSFYWEEGLLLLLALLIGFSSSVLPAVRAMRMDIAEVLKEG